MCFSSSRQAKYGSLHPEAVEIPKILHLILQLIFFPNNTLFFKTRPLHDLVFVATRPLLETICPTLGFFLLYFFMFDICVLVFLVTLLPVSVALREEKGEFCFLAGHVTSFKMEQRNLHLLIKAANTWVRYEAKIIELNGLFGSTCRQRLANSASPHILQR